jgi:hypothetical protein
MTELDLDEHRERLTKAEQTLTRAEVYLEKATEKRNTVMTGLAELGVRNIKKLDDAVAAAEQAVRDADARAEALMEDLRAALG